jgi:D-sedoheptulose 7-phosphate isomerase
MMLEAQVRALQAALEQLRSDEAAHAALACVVDDMEGALRAGGTVFTAGNGGSMADAMHLTAELVGRFVLARDGWASVTLNANASSFSSIANDFDFTETLCREIRALVRPRDQVVFFTTSGRSPNLVAAARTAREIGASVAVFTGARIGPIAEHCPAGRLVVAPAAETPRVQELHTLLLHAAVGELERRYEAAPW